MRKMMWSAIGLATTALSVASACGRSENIGWSDREKPDSIVARGRASQQRAADLTAQREENAVTQEHRQLAQSLSRLQMQAISDALLNAEWNRLIADIDSTVLGKSGFHRGLIDRKDEIERLLQESADTLTDQQRNELRRHYGNIQMEMGRVRNQEMRSPEFAERFLAFHQALFDKMRELAPSRTAEIDRLEQLELQSFAPDTMAAIPGMQPIR